MDTKTNNHIFNRRLFIGSAAITALSVGVGISSRTSYSSDLEDEVISWINHFSGSKCTRVENGRSNIASVKVDCPEWSEFFQTLVHKYPKLRIMKNNQMEITKGRQRACFSIC